MKIATGSDMNSARAEVLARVLVLQQTLDALPDEASISEFTCRALMTVPGVSQVLIHLCAPALSPDLKLQELRAQCLRAGCMPPAALDSSVCNDQPGSHYFPMRAASRLFGLLVVQAADEALLAPYLAYLSNIANVVSRVLDTRRYQKQLADTNELLLQRTCELKDSNRKLEVEIGERKRTEAALARRSQELTYSNTELEQLAYVASHDLQEPLRMVSSYLQLLENKYNEQLDAEAHEYIEFAVDGATRLQALIGDLLMYSRVGTSPPRRQPVDCTAVLEITRHALRAAIKESGAEIQSTVLPVVMGDKAQLTQLFQNLLANAIKFCGPQAPRISVRAEPDGNGWRIEVEDSGIGIEPEYFDRIFVMFQRLHARSAYPGTGVGLAICKKIVERHGGRIWVEAAPEQGTVFKFTLPQIKGGADHG
ncbi:MAG TPA: ATP-binding protein [Janthinobacterium sp.]|nr:ATP-binding protein [Janthinobacterium sp.]